MTDLRSLLASLQRPRLLIRAARHGLVDYRRDRDLRRLIGSCGAASPDVSVRPAAGGGGAAGNDPLARAMPPTAWRAISNC